MKTTSGWWAWMLVCGLVLAVSPATADDFYVDVSWGGTESGSQAEPYATIKAAVDAANAIDATHNIYIAAGWYGDVANGGTEDYSAGGAADGNGGINITRRINFYGGYGGVGEWGTRNPRTTQIDLAGAGSRAFYNKYGTHKYNGPLFDGLSFSNANHSANGGCISTSGDWGTTYYVNDCLFVSNTVTGSGDGGALHLNDSASGSYIRNCEFIDNVAAGDQGGAVQWIFGYGGSRDLSDCRFAGNRAAVGGALYIDGGGIVQRTTFDGNEATSYGGALYNHRGNTTIRTSVLASNAAPAGAAVGHGHNEYWGGGYFMQNCLVYDNTGGYAVQSEGNRLSSYSLDMLHCVVVGNAGGGARFENAGGGTVPGRVRNSIFTRNGAYAVYRTADPYVLAHNNVYDNTNSYHNCTPDSGSISADPDFIDAAGHDYRLAVTSPSIDAGTNDTGLVTDFIGTTRPTRNGWDQGAYEELEACRIQNLSPVVTPTNVVLRGQLDYDGGMDAYVHIYWGAVNGGTNRSAWANTNVIGLLASPDTFSATNEVTTGETYWFRCFVSNSYDEVWADASWSFVAEAVHIWTGLAGDGLASTPGNWFNNDLPTPAGTVKLDSYDADMTWDAAAPHSVARWVQTDQYDGTAVIGTGWSNGFDTLSIAGDVTIEGGTLSHRDNTTGGSALYRLKVDIGGDLTVAAGTAIDASGRGYENGTGPGAGTGNQVAGTHGGEGYINTNACYGSVWEPVTLGSGGGGTQGRDGGGAVYLTVDGACTVAGTITADGETTSGQNYYGGAGGSVCVRAAALTGGGTIRANGSGEGYGAAGAGGGRVAVILTNDTTFGSVTMQALGFGSGVYGGRAGAAGTVYRESTDHTPNHGVLIIDNANVWLARRARTVIPAVHPLEQFAEIVIRNDGVLGFEPGDAFDFGDMANVSPESADEAFITVRDTTGITFPSPFTIGGYTLRLDTPLSVTSDWTVAADGNLSHSPHDSTGATRVDLTLDGSLTVDGTIDVRPSGYNGGPGYTSSQCGSYGGLGDGAAAGKCYGSILEPAHLGSSAATLGGGHVRLDVSGNVAINGSILAGCLPADTREGSGGTVNIRAGTLSGSGTVDATGGRVTSPSWSEHGGGGGRIAARLSSATAFADVDFTAAGGGGGQGGGFVHDGGAGTVYLQSAGQAEGGGWIIIDNADHNSPALTEFPPTQLFSDELLAATLSITNGAQVSLTGDVRIGDLHMSADSEFYLNGYECRVNRTFHRIDGTPTGPGEVIWITGTVITIR